VSRVPGRELAESAALGGVRADDDGIGSVGSLVGRAGRERENGAGGPVEAGAVCGVRECGGGEEVPRLRDGKG
jgi:hypothetical protein